MKIGRRLGRTYTKDEILWCAHSGTGVEFVCQGENLTVSFKGSNASMIKGNNKKYPRVAVYVNGERVVDTQIDEIYKNVDIKLNPDEISNVKIIKLSESMESIFGIGKITLDGSTEGFTPTPEKDFLIEFIGDSITCGYGVDAAGKEETFSTETEDFTDSYAYLTAQNLGADISVVAFSGHGIISGYSANGIDKTDLLVPKYYNKIGASYDDKIDGKDIADIEYVFERKPDLIVINLGTNDDSYCLDDAAKQAEFTDAYVSFLRTVRAYNPDAVILCTLGIMGDRLYPAVEKAAVTFAIQTGDSKVFFKKFDVQNPSDGYGADWHPSAATHIKASESLTAWIKDLGYLRRIASARAGQSEIVE
ncbi:MAG: GDSL-type esterase/lipase family protein [Ruminococcus sp.]|jgi:lysophospholipase L1-like esterase|nr:GDSL-type esterase/lipase family protein [Ruminococcus sp.]